MFANLRIADSQIGILDFCEFWEAARQNVCKLAGLQSGRYADMQIGRFAVWEISTFVDSQTPNFSRGSRSSVVVVVVVVVRSSRNCLTEIELVAVVVVVVVVVVSQSLIEFRRIIVLSLLSVYDSLFGAF